MNLMKRTRERENRRPVVTISMENLERRKCFPLAGENEREKESDEHCVIIQLRKLTIVLLSKHASTDEEKITKIQRIHDIYVDRAYTNCA